MADQFRRKLDQGGPGGIHCGCCRDDGRGKFRFRLTRQARSRLKFEVRKEIEKELIH